MKTYTPSFRASLGPFLFAFLSLAAFAPFGRAQTETTSPANAPAAESGLEIAIESDRRDTGFGDTKVNAKMILRNKQGQSSTREFEIKTIEQEGDGDKSLLTFGFPRDVRGTSLLTFTHKIGEDDQWLYLPALKRVKRISSSNKSGPFVGSEFAYEDIASQEVEKYTYRYLGDEIFEGKDCFKVESDPLDPKSGYKRRVAWIDKEHYRNQQVHFYDRNNAHVKTLKVTGYVQYLETYWRPTTFMMTNLRNGKSTELQFGEWTFRSGLGDNDFSQSALKRSR